MTLEDDAETRGFLGEEGSVIDQLEAEVLGDAGLERNQHRATTFRSVYGVYCSVENNADALAFLYESAKAALIRARVAMLGVPGTDSVVIRGGPLSVDPTKIPTNWLFLRIFGTIERRYEVAPRAGTGRVRTLRTFQLFSETEARDEDGVVWTRAGTSA